MTCIYDDPETFATRALEGFSHIYARHVHLVNGGVIRSTATPANKVALVVGGGAGHYPAFAGFVGPGLADAAIAGDVFASPSAHSIAHVARMAHRGGGILLGFGKYAGDVMNFGLAAERLISEGIDVRQLPITDDIARAPPESAHLRRGVAGDLAVLKIAGAAAEAGWTLDEVERIAISANARTVSLGVAFSGCTLPGAKAPLFSVPEARMAVGLGIHGEPGISESNILPASELAALLVNRLVAEKPKDSNGRVGVILNGLGNTKYEELFVLWTSIDAELKKAQLIPVMPEVGEFVTSLDMAGCSLTLTWLDDALEKMWCAPVDSPVLRRGAIIPSNPIPAPAESTDAAISFAVASNASRKSAQCLADILEKIAQALRGAEEELGRIDALAGDGDHGQGMTRGSAAAATAAQKAAQAGAGIASTLAVAGDAWADRAGGTSGALWGLALRTWSTALSDTDEPSPQAIAHGAKAGLEAVMRLGHAKPGDKTLVDAYGPFVSTLIQKIETRESLKQAWEAAAHAASQAADATADLTPKLGRARSHAARSLGHPDAGAISFALCARIVGQALS